MNSFKKAIAVVLSAVTMATTWVGAIPVFADEVSSGEMGTVYVKLTDNGSVKVTAQDEETSYRLKDDEVQSKDSNGEVVTVNCDNADYDFKVEKPIGTTLDVKAVADLGYKVSEYSTTTDSGDVSEDDLSNEISTNTDSVVVDEKPQYVTVSFDAISVSMDKEEELNDLDFSTCRLLVGSSVEDVLNDVSVLSTYNGVSLLQFPSEDATRRAYIALSKIADFVNVDTADFEVSNIANVEEDKMSEGINPIGELSEADTEEVSQSNVIAVIDTGSSERDNVIERVSMLGDDVSDDNGHGDEMISKILSQDKDAKVISIKAMDSNGKGTTSSVYAGLQYAIEKKVDIINMSFVGIANEDNSSIKELIETAINQGITVVGAAGNNGTDASYFIPGCVEGAYIIGVANSDGTRLENSNYGKTVDYNVVADSTSEASALFTGYLSKHKAIDDVNSNNLIYSTDYKVKSGDKLKEDKPEEPDEISKVKSLPKDDTKVVLVKYLLLDKSKITGAETIDKVMLSNQNSVLYQLESYVPVYEDGDSYKVVANTPFVNGTSSGKFMDVIFARGNDKGIVVKDGVSFDFDSNIATISKDAIKTDDTSDFANIQIQLLATTSLNTSAKVNVTVEDGKGKLLHKETFSNDPYEYFSLLLDTNKSISADDISVFINGSNSALNKKYYSVKENVLSIGSFGVLSDVRVVINKEVNSSFKVCLATPDSGVTITEDKIPKYYLKTNTDVSMFKGKENTSTTVNIFVGRYGYPADTRDGGLGSLKPLYGWYSPYGDPTTTIGISKTIKFNGKPVNFQFYDEKGNLKGSYTGNSDYNTGFVSYCHHASVSAPSGSGVREAEMRLLKYVDGRKSDGSGYIYLTFAIESKGYISTTPSGTQTTGGIFKIAVPYSSNKIKLQMAKDSSVIGFNTDYSRAGAKYYIYTDKSCTKPFKFGGKDAYITIDENGYGKLGEGSGVNNDSKDKDSRFWGKNSGADIQKGTYYAKEKDSPTSGKYTCGSKFQKTGGNNGYYKFVSVGKKDSKNIPIYRAHYFNTNNKDVGTPLDDPLILLQLKKSSATPEFTNGNSCYSLKGAVYNIYWTQKDADRGINVRGTMTTDEDGYATYYDPDSGHYGTNNRDTDTVYKNKDSGTPVRAAQRDTNEFQGWYIKEVTAPKGYALDKTVYQLTDSHVTNSKGLKIYRPNGNSKGITDEPLNDPFLILIEKHNAITGKSENLKDAVFKLEYYTEYLDSTKYKDSFEVDSSDPNAEIPKFTTSKPTRIWYIKTDADGYAELSDDYIQHTSSFNSDDVYTVVKKDGTEKIVVPYGTLKVTEVQAPEKYKLTPVIYYRALKESSLAGISQVELPVDETPKVEMDTVAVDTDTNSHNGFTSAKTCVSDTITYSNLTGGKEYSIKGMLIKKSDGSKIPLLNEDGTILKDSKGNQATEKSVTMTASANGSGHYSIKYYFNSIGLEKDSVVAYAFIYDKATGELLGSHEDITDADQTVSFRGRELSMITVATNDATDSAISYIPDDGWGYISDKVSYVGLDKNRSYRLKTEIYEIENGKVSDTPVDINTSGMNFVKAIYTKFRPASDSGTVKVSNIRFRFPEGKVDLTTRKFVVYETLIYDDGSSIMKDGKVDPGSIHKDPNDTNQIVTYSDLPIDTIAKVSNASGKGKVGYISGKLSQTWIEETITLENLNATEEYQLSPYLVLKSSGKVLDKAKVYLVDAKGKKTLITESAEGGTFVPNGGGWSYGDGRFKFTALAKTQMIKLAFDVSAYKDILAGEEVVVCEEIGGVQSFDDEEFYYTYGEHDDLDDKDQTVKFISSTVKTKASMASTDTQYGYALGNDNVKDTVSLTGLIAGQTYSLQGRLVDKVTGQSINSQFTNKTFVATAESMEVEMNLGIDTSSLAGKDIVAYEKLYYRGSLIASHEDINDTDQTVTILNPTIKTSASDNRHDISRDDVSLRPSSNIYDTVSMTGLIPGKTYKIEGQVIEKSSEEPVTLKDTTSATTNGTNLVVTLSENNLSATTTFTAVGESQDVVFHYVFDSTYYAGKSVVVVEDLYYGDNLIATHRDLTDTDQTLTYKSEGSLKITKVDSNTGEVVKDSATFNLYKVNDDGTETLVDGMFTSTNRYQLGQYIYTKTSGKYTDLLTYPERCMGNLVKSDYVGTMSITGLPSGKYKLKEVKAPTNYIISEEDGIEVEIVNGKVTETTVRNTPRLTSFTFVKTDDNANVEKSKVLAGAGFTLYTDEACEVQAKDFYGNVVSESLSDKLTGIVGFNNLLYSDVKDTVYYMRETTAPEGYVPLDYTIKAVIDTEGNAKLYNNATSEEITELKKVYLDEGNYFSNDLLRVTNHRGSVVLNKKDENGDNLAGSEWELHKVTKAVADDGTVSYTKDEVVSVDATKAQGTYRAEDLQKGTSILKTSDEGVLSIGNLPLGDYYLVETKAPENKMPYGEKIEFSLTADKPDIGLTDDGITVIDNKPFLPKTGSFGDMGIYWIGLVSLLISLSIFALALARAKKIKNILKRG